MTVASVPSLIGAVSRQIDEIIETTFLSVTPDLAVEITPVAHSVYRFTPFGPEDLLARVLRISDLHPVAKIDGANSMDVHQDRLDECADHLDNGDADAALSSLGGDPAHAAKLLDAMKTKRSSSQVTILHKPASGRVEGGSIAWIDAGFGGIWTMEELDGAGDTTGMIRIENRDSRELAVELFGFLPDAFTAEDAAVAASASRTPADRASAGYGRVVDRIHNPLPDRLDRQVVSLTIVPAQLRESLGQLGEFAGSILRRESGEILVELVEVTPLLAGHLPDVSPITGDRIGGHRQDGTGGPRCQRIFSGDFCNGLASRALKWS